MNQLVLLTSMLISVGVSAQRVNHSMGAAAVLHVQANHGIPFGSLELTFTRSARVFTSPERNLSPVVGRWLTLAFRSHSGHVFRLAHYTLEKWPSRDGIRSFRPGDVMITSFSLEKDDLYFLEDESSRRVDRLPPGQYVVTARLVVPSNAATRRFNLTPLCITAAPVSLTISTE